MLSWYLLILLLIYGKTGAAELTASCASKQSSAIALIDKLAQSYPGHFTIKNNYKSIAWADNTVIIIDDTKKKDFAMLLSSPDIQDQLAIGYPVGKCNFVGRKNNDPGRIRNDLFFKKMYGATKEQVQKKLTTIQ